MSRSYIRSSVARTTRHCVPAIIHAVCDPDSPFKDEGRNLLIDEFGKHYGTYFSILDAISSGINTQSGIASMLGEKSIGGHLKKLEETYGIIRKMRPILSKKGTQTVRYEISDMFLRFWFRYFEGNRTLVEMNQYEVLEKSFPLTIPHGPERLSKNISSSSSSKAMNIGISAHIGKPRKAGSRMKSTSLH